MVIRKNLDGFGIVLGHHGVVMTSEDLNPLEQKRHVSQDYLRDQLRTLQQNGFEFVALSRLVDDLKRGHLTGRKAAVTFDDGLFNTVEFGAPVLREFSAKASIFAVAECVELGCMQWTDVVEQNWLMSSYAARTESPEDWQSLMNFKKSLRSCSLKERDRVVGSMRSQIPTQSSILTKVLRASDLDFLDTEIFELAAHSFTHPSLKQMSSPEIRRRQIHDSKVALAAASGRDISLYAYPFGEYDQAMKREVENSGYSAAFTVVPNPIRNGDDLFELGRFEPAQWDILQWE